MAHPRGSHGPNNGPESAPEVVQISSNVTTFSISDDYNYYEPQAPEPVPFRSPAPEYRRYPASPPLSASSAPLGSQYGASPSISENGSKLRPMSPPIQYSEIHSPAPQTVYKQYDTNTEKEACAKPLATTTIMPVVERHSPESDQPRRPWWKRLPFIAGIVLLVIFIAVGVGVGVTMSKKSSSNSTSQSAPPTSTDGSGNTVTINGDPETSVGGYLSDSYYSKEGAWNGSGIAIAAANPGVDETIYAFFQDFRGDLQYTLRSADGSWQLIGPIAAGSHKPLNGTPISAVNHVLRDDASTLVWHVFYIDENHILRERVLTNSTTETYSHIWDDGPLSAKNLKTFEGDTIGMQGCYWGNYYGLFSNDGSQPTAGIQMFYASSATTFEMYSWTNGTDTWSYERTFKDLDGHAGVGCQTWASGLTEYVWFVNTKQEIQMYWKDNNQSANPTSTHPINVWTPIDIGITNVHKSSSLGYTNYMLYQSTDHSIRGANITFAAENTTIATTTTTSSSSASGALDEWTISDVQDNKDVLAVGGTHMCITALKTPSQGSILAVIFQEGGDDISMYTRDGFTTGGMWQLAKSPV